MTALDFPNTPTVGETFSGVGGTVWRWSGSLWESTSGPSGPRGVVGSARKAATEGGFVGVMADISNLTVTLNLGTGRQYCVELINTSCYSTVSNDIVGILLYAGAVHIGQANFKLHTAGEVQGIPTIKAYFTSTGGSTVVKARIIRQSGTGTVSVYSAGGWVPEIVVTDVTYESGNAGTSGPWPLGVVGYSQRLSAINGIPGTQTTLTDLSVTFTAIAGRRYKVSHAALWNSDVANNGVAVNLYNTTAATVLQEAICQWLLTSGSGRDMSLSLIWSGTLTPGTVTLQMRALRTVGSGNVNLTAAASAPAFILVEDAGIA